VQWRPKPLPAHNPRWRHAQRCTPTAPESSLGQYHVSDALGCVQMESDGTRWFMLSPPTFLVSSVIQLVKHNVMYGFFIFCSRWWEEHPPDRLFELENVVSELFQQLLLTMPICFRPFCNVFSAPLWLLFSTWAWFKVHCIDPPWLLFSVPPWLSHCH
jgi:hypothetical protein